MKYVLIMFLILPTLIFSEIERNPIKWKGEQVIIRDSLFVKEVNDIRFRAQYDSVEQVLARLDSITTDSVIMSSGWIKMQPSHADTLYNKPAIIGASNVVVQSPDNYTLYSETDDTTGFGGNQSVLKWENKEHIVISGGIYIHNLRTVAPGNGMIGFYNCKNILVENLTIRMIGDSLNDHYATSPLSFINCDSVTVRNVIIENNADSGININGCKAVLIDNVTIKTKSNVGFSGAHTCITISSASSTSKDGTDDVKVINSHLHGGTHSIIDIENNTVNATSAQYDVRNVFVGNCVLTDTTGAISGVHIYGGRIQDVNISNVRVVGAKRGVYVEKASAGGYVRRIRYHNVKATGGDYGAWVRGGHNIRFNYCVFDSNSVDGMKFDASASRSDSITILNTRACKNGRNGLWIESSAGNNNRNYYIANCEFHHNGQTSSGTGLSVTRVDTLRVLGCNSYYNDKGFSFGTSDVGYVTECVAWDNTTDAFTKSSLTNYAFNDNVEGVFVEDTGISAKTLYDITLDFNDSNTQIWEDGSGNLTFKDANAGTVTLSDLDFGGGGDIEVQDIYSSNSYLVIYDNEDDPVATFANDETTYLAGDLDVTGSVVVDPGADVDILDLTLPSGAGSEFFQCTLDAALVNIVNQDGWTYTPRVSIMDVNYAGGVTGSIRPITGGGLHLYNSSNTGLSVYGTNGRVTIGAANEPGLSFEVARASSSTYSAVTGGVNYGDAQWLYLLSGTAENSIVWDSSNNLRFGVETSIGSGYAQVAEIQGDGDLELMGVNLVIDDDGHNWTFKATASGLELYQGTTLIMTFENDGTITDEVP